MPFPLGPSLQVVKAMAFIFTTGSLEKWKLTWSSHTEEACTKKAKQLLAVNEDDKLCAVEHIIMLNGGGRLCGRPP